MRTFTAYCACEAHGTLLPKQFERRELRADDVAIDIAYCGVCHSDVHQVNNDWTRRRAETITSCKTGFADR